MEGLGRRSAARRHSLAIAAKFGLLLIPAVAWMYHSGDALWASVLLLFAIVAMTMGNFLRPVLISKGVDLPLLLILAGVIGGLLAMGLLGIFLCPTVLAVAYTLQNAWMAECEEAPWQRREEESSPASALAGQADVLKPIVRHRRRTLEPCELRQVHHRAGTKGADDLAQRQDVLAQVLAPTASGARGVQSPAPQRYCTKIPKRS